MLSKSNSRIEAGKANQRGFIVGCPYSQDPEVVKTSLAMIDTVGKKLQQVLEEKGTDANNQAQFLVPHQLEKMNYVLSMVLMYGVFQPMQSILWNKKDEIYEHVSQILSTVDVADIPEKLKESVCRYILFLTLQELDKGLIEENIPSIQTEKLYKLFSPFRKEAKDEFILANSINPLGLSQAQAQTKIFQHALMGFFKLYPDTIKDENMLQRLFVYLISSSHISRNVFIHSGVSSYESFSRDDFSIIRETVLGQTVDNLSVGFASTYGIVSGIAKSFTKQEGFHELDEDEKKAMFFSTKQDLLSQAMYWSKKFVKANRGGDSLINPPEGSSELDVETLVFNFEQKKIFIDGTKQLQESQEPGHTHRTCLASHVKTEGISGSLTSNQVDMALELYWENYVSQI